MNVERMEIIGIEISEGKSSKSNRDYSIGTLHLREKLAPPLGGGSNVAKGYAGSKLSCDVAILRAIAHLPFPVVCDVTTETVVRFGERLQTAIDVKPVERVEVKKAA